MRILEFARAGRNVEAFRVYEFLPDRDQSDIAVWRAVAGCYWRERRFEEARTLYREIMERQSSLSAIGLGGQEESSTETPSAAAPAVVLPEPEEEPAVVLPEPQEEPEEVAATAESSAVQEETKAPRDVVEAPEPQHAEPGPEALPVRIVSLEQELVAARQMHATLRANADQKLNDLLDAIEAEKTRREKVEAELKAVAAMLERQKASASADFERQMQAVSEQLTREQRLAADAAADYQLREVELRARVAQITAVGEDARLQVALLEQMLEQLRGRLDTVTAQLASRDREEAQETGHVGHASLALALDEIERLEQEQAEKEAAAAQQQAQLQERNEALEMQVSSADRTLTSVRRELDGERRQRFDLEAQTREQAEALEETAAMLAEAKAALARQYDVLREHVQGGKTIRLGNDQAPGMADVQVTPPAPDLVPMIGQLETATATAVAEVRELREQLEHERSALAVVVAAKEAELSALRAEMATLQQQVSAVAAAATGRESAMEAAHTDAMAAMARAHELRVAGLKSQIDALKLAVATRDRAVLLLEDDRQAGPGRVIDAEDEK